MITPLQPIYLLCCTRESRNSDEAFEHWVCSSCGYIMGASIDLPPELCPCCNARLYTDKASKATLLVRDEGTLFARGIDKASIFIENGGNHFTILRDLRK